MTDIQRVSFNAGFMLFLTQAKFPPFVIKPGGSALNLIITPGWRIWGEIGTALVALYDFDFFKKKSSRKRLNETVQGRSNTFPLHAFPLLILMKNSCEMPFCCHFKGNCFLNGKFTQ